jgi:hypothetical protein
MHIEGFGLSRVDHGGGFGPHAADRDEFREPGAFVSRVVAERVVDGGQDLLLGPRDPTVAGGVPRDADLPSPASGAWSPDRSRMLRRVGVVPLTVDHENPRPWSVVGVTAVPERRPT